MLKIGLLFSITLVALTGCAKQYDIVTAPEQASMGHYVLVQATKAGGMKLWDCQQMPDGQSWDPTCVRVRMQNSARDQSQ